MGPKELLVVMAGHSRSKNGVALLAYVPAIYVFPAYDMTGKTWIPGTSPGLTNFEIQCDW
jgi:hypothetical protein